jgi:CRISPR-associated protein Csm3
MATEAAGHHKLVNRYSLDARLVCETALHVGASTGGDDFQGSDLPVAKDGKGRPYIPGSSLRGALRAGLESLLRGLDRADTRVCDPFERDEHHADRSCSERTNAKRQTLKSAGSEPISEAAAFDLAWEESCEICRLFGQLFLASRVRISDFSMVSTDSRTYVRDGVGLDRDLRTAAQGILYNFEAVPAGTGFGLRLEVENAEPHEIGLVLTGLDLFGQGALSVGGKSARGLGLARVEEIQLTRRTAADYFTDEPPRALGADELDALRAAARKRYVEGGGD